MCKDRDLIRISPNVSVCPMSDVSLNILAFFYCGGEIWVERLFTLSEAEVQGPNQIYRVKRPDPERAK